jgi:hypothetical protein
VPAKLQHLQELNMLKTARDQNRRKFGKSVFICPQGKKEAFDDDDEPNSNVDSSSGEETKHRRRNSSIN